MKRDGVTRRAMLSAPLSLAALAAVPAAAAAGDRTARQLLQAFLDSLTAHDLKAFRALYADEGYVQHQTLVTSKPSSTSGPDAAAAYFRKRIDAFPDLTVASDVALVEGELIAANLVWSGTHQGDYLGLPATGRRVSFNSTDIMRVRGGLFIEHWGAADLYGLVAQLKG